MSRVIASDARYTFAGNRSYVLQKMIEFGLDIVKIWAVKDSYLERFLISNAIEYNVIDSKLRLCEEISETSFDFFVSNGLPLILPISDLKNDNREFINIHPSLLPDLRGCDPVLGAILYNRDSGATCHVMDDGIDTGGIISQVRIPMTDDLDVGFLYQLSFMAEVDAFKLAYQRNFKVIHNQSTSDSDIYYTFKNDDLLIGVNDDSVEKIMRKVKAFSIRNKGARIQIDDVIYIVIRATVITNPYAIDSFAKGKDMVVLMTYEDNIIVKVSGILMSMQLKCEELYENGDVKFPIIGAVIKQMGGGCVLADSETDPHHIFVVSSFGFCQELFDEYDVFFSEEIRRYIKSSTKKLRMYDPSPAMREWLDGFDNAHKSVRKHFSGKHKVLRDQYKKNKSPEYSIARMESYNETFDFGLNLPERYYNSVNDFILYGKPIVATSNNGTPAGIVYSAGYDGLRNEVDIFVEPSFRCTGIASRLTDCFISVVDSINEETSWDCYSDNIASSKLAEYIGFEQVYEYWLYNIESNSA